VQREDKPGTPQSSSIDEDPLLLRRQICRGLNRIEEAAAEAKRRNREVLQCLNEVQADITRISDRMSAARQQRQQRLHPNRGAPREEAGRPGAGACGLGVGGGASGDWFSRSAAPSQGPRMPPPTPPQARRRAAEASATPQAATGSSPSQPKVGRRYRTSSLLRGSGGGQGRGAAAPPEAKEAKAEPPPCTRAAQEGFSFGGVAPPPAASHEAPPMASYGQSSSADDMANVAGVQEAIRAQLLAARHRGEAERRAAVKRLLVKWHPDRNPESVEIATAAFQYIQQEKEELLGL